MSVLDRKSLENQLKMAERSLSILQSQVGGFGNLHAPGHLKLQLDLEQEKIKNIKEILAAMPLTLSAAPDQGKPGPAFEISKLINKPVSMVFQAVIDPQLVAQYFPNRAFGQMLAGNKVVWEWDSGERIEIKVEDMLENRRIIARWEAYKVNYEVRFVITFEAKAENITLVKINEGTWQNNPVGLESAFAQCAGWTEMLMYLKGWLEYGIDLRK